MSNLGKLPALQTPDSAARDIAALGSVAFERDGLFTKPAYRNIQEVIVDEQKRG